MIINKYINIKKKNKRSYGAIGRHGKFKIYLSAGSNPVKSIK